MPIRTDRRSLTAPASTTGASPSTGRRIGPTAARAATTTTPGLTSALGIAPATAVDLASHSTPGRLPGPLNFILRALDATNRSIGDAIEHPLHAIPGNAKAPGIRELMRHPENYKSISGALDQRGAYDWIPNKYGLRPTAKLASDIFLDPTTYITFGAGASLNTVAKSAGRAAALRAFEDAATHGGGDLLRLNARLAVEDALAQSLAPKTLKANFRVPFSRSKDINIFETGIAHRVGGAAKAKLPESVGKDMPDFIKQVVGTNRGIEPLSYAAYQDTRRVVSPMEHDVKVQAKTLDDVIAQAAKDAGLSRKQADEMLWWHAQSPATHAIPEALQPALDAAKTLFAHVETADVQAGVLTKDRLLENYLPHLADSQKGNRVLRSAYAQRSTDKLYDPFYTQERLAKTPEAFKKAGEQHGFTPEHNLAKLFEARAKASIRARQLRAIDESLKEVTGFKPPAHSTVEARAAFEEAKAGAAAARVRLEHVMSPRPTEALRAETKAAQEELRAAKADYERLLKLGQDVHGIRAAKWRLMEAERKAAGQKAYALRAAQESALPEFQRLMASARATGARLPKPTGGKITMPAELKKLSSKLRRFRTKITGESKKLRESVADDLRAEAKARRATYKPSAQSTRAQRSVRGPGLQHSHSQNFAETGRVKFNAGNENSGVHYRTAAQGGGRKTLADYEQDYVNELAMQVDRYGIDALTPKDRVVYEAMTQAGELDALAYEIDSAFQHASGGAFGELDQAAGLKRLQELADSLVGSNVTRDFRAQRTRAAGGLPQAQGLEAVSPRAQAAIERYFTGPANTLRDRAAEVRTGAEADVVAAIASADKKVAQAKRAVEKASKGPNPAFRKEARRRLVRAQADARNARLALERARAGYEGNPREVLSAFRSMLKAAEAEKAAGKKLGALERANMLLELRPGRPTTPEEWKALEDGWMLVGAGTETARGVKLPTEVAAGLNEVHKLVSPILSDEPLRVAGRFIAGFTSRWKVLALLSPGYHVRNQIDDGIRAFMAGARNPRSFGQAARILKGGIHEASETATIRIGRKTYTHAEYLRRARAYGVIDAGFVRTEVMSSGQSDISKTFWGIHTPGRGRLSQASSHVGNYRENVNRLGTFIELEKGGRSPLIAARRTREFLIDYGEVGRFVDAARKFVFPFITYPSKVIPIYARELARHPGFYAHLSALENTLNEAAGNPDLTQLQAYNRSSFAVPLPGIVRSALGVQPGSSAIVNPNGLLGVGSLDMLDPHKNALTSNIGGSLLNPMLRVPTEIATQRSLYFNSNLSRLATAPQFLKWAHDAGIPVPTYVPPGGNGSERGKVDYTGKAVPGYSSYMAELLGMLPIYSQSSRVTSPDSSSRANAIAKILFGIPISSYDATRQAGYAATHQRG